MPDSPVSGKIEAIEVDNLTLHHHEVFQELLLRVVTCIDCRKGAQLGVRAEDKVNMVVFTRNRSSASGDFDFAAGG
jgi:hypothetical protein